MNVPEQAAIGTLLVTIRNYAEALHKGGLTRNEQVSCAAALLAYAAAAHEKVHAARQKARDLEKLL